jgi:hypothetical protein
VAAAVPECAGSLRLKFEGGTHYWLRLGIASGIHSGDPLPDLPDECDQLIAILTRIIKKLRTKR